MGSNMTITESLNLIRSIINKPRIHHQYFQNKETFFQLCSSMDAIADTENSISAYPLGKELEKQITDKGTIYLLIYGLLQSMFLQQDAVINLAEAIGSPLNLKDYPKLVNVREIRNNSIGHPTKRGKSKKLSFHFINYRSVKLSGFRLMSSKAKQETEFKDIDISELISDQRYSISCMLKKMIDFLKRTDKEHREKFKMKKLVDILQYTIGYPFEKFNEGIRRESHKELAKGLFEEYIVNTIEKFTIALNERGIEKETYDNLGVTLDNLEYPVKKLTRYFAESPDVGENVIDDKTAKIFIFYLRHQFIDLIKTASVIDEEYACDGPNVENTIG